MRRLSAEAVQDIVDYDKPLIYKVHHKLEQLCSVHNLREAYIDIFHQKVVHNKPGEGSAPFDPCFDPDHNSTALLAFEDLYAGVKFAHPLHHLGKLKAFLADLYLGKLHREFHFIAFLPLAVSVFTLMALSIDRYIAIAEVVNTFYSPLENSIQFPMGFL